MLKFLIGLNRCETGGCEFTYNGHLSTFSRGVLLIPKALRHNFVKGEPSPK